jgi:membrane dipeptidase
MVVTPQRTFRRMPDPAPAHPARWWLDAHLDLAYLHLGGPSVTQELPDPAVRGVSLPALARGDVRIFLGTIFTELGAEAAKTAWGYTGHDDLAGAHAAGVRQLEVYETLEREGRARIIRTRADLDACAAAPAGSPPGIVILMEGADPIRTPDEVAWWHTRGVRVVGLTWALGSRYAGGNGNTAHGPLTALGRRAVEAMDAVGILHDASHLCDESFDGLCAATNARIVATHSNARALAAPVQRHLTDAQVAEIAARDGMVGLNLFGKFLADGRPATLADAVRHVQHAASIAGRSRVGLGSDFDGGFTPADCPPGCGRPEELPALGMALGNAGFSSAELDAFAHGNWLRTLRAALR